ncbi:MAG: ATP-binding protein, partial [Candidatus Eisenbacteria bacterium]|nr:ATP-binding protein [Candidatus Eisenbacteria bacterium]
WCGPAGEGLLTVIAGQLAMAIHLARVQQKLAQAEARLRDAETDRLRCEKLAALGEISAKLAHEIRNPLSAIGGFARRIQKGLPANDPNGDYASIIVREIERLEAMVAEQLQFAKPIAPRVAMVDLNEVVRAAVQIAREEAEGRGIDLREQYQGGIPPMLLAPDRLEQVLLNIVRNAMQSTREGQRIAVMTRATEGWAQIDVANNGERLEAEALERLFIPFASGRSAGSGLGLAIADQIVREHGGEIRVRTDPSWSVIFTVSLPIRSNAERRRGQDRRRRNRDRAA